MQNRITQADTLFNADGTLKHRGWATQPLLEYNRSALPSSWSRTKEWEFYGAYDEDFGVEAVVADLGIFTLIGTVFHDFKTHKLHRWGGLIPLTRGKVGLSSNPIECELNVKNLLFGSIVIEKKPHQHRLQIDAPKFKKFKVDITYKINRDDDAMVVATGYENSKHFYYNYKKNMLDVSGEVSFQGETRTLSAEHASGNFDWGRGYWPYQTRWFWGTGAGRIGNEKVWFNIGYGFGDLSTHSENMIFVNGKVHKTSQVTFHTQSKFSRKDWTFTSDDNRINLTLKPLIDCSGKFSLGFAKADINQIHGLYYGTLVLDDGREIQVDGIHGHAEDISYLW